MPFWVPISAESQHFMNGLDPLAQVALLVIGVVSFGIIFYIISRKKPDSPIEGIMLCRICDKLVFRRLDAIKHCTIKHSIECKEWYSQNHIVMATRQDEFNRMVEYFFETRGSQNESH